MRLLQGSGQPDGVGDVASRDEAILRPGLPAEVLLSAERAHHGDAEGPREHNARYQHSAQRNTAVAVKYLDVAPAEMQFELVGLVRVP